MIVFEAVARLGSVTKAAEALHLAQPTVSTQLKKLSEALELQLFEQRGRHLLLTAAGREVLCACQELIALLLRTEARLSTLREGEGGVLRIAVVAGARQLAARALASFCGRHPGVQASLHVGNRAELMERLASQEDHLYIVALPDDACGVKAYAFASQKLRFFCAAASALARMVRVPLEELAHHAVVVREAGSGTRSTLEALVGQVHGELRIRAELCTDEAVAEAAAAGLGMALLPTEVAAPFVASGSLAAIDADLPVLERRWHLVHAERAPLPASGILFIRELALEVASPVQAGQPLTAGPVSRLPAVQAV
ncbi:MAG: hypothetical protein A3G81_12765 [Betaproteobacteria bacterium RIFCSPLOWO2_12_FULL_65_14]|nr:MAG: hypothetical protein A3G81_12765 [Betaproteobacteria bacterium RIFCSPLOWO2_12_FULL_65_14]